MPSLSEIFGAPAASKPKLSFGDIFGSNDYPSAPFVNQPTLTPPAPQPEFRDQFLDGPTLPPMAQGWEEIAAKHQDEWVNGAYQVDTEPFRLSYERETDPDLKTQYWYDWQNALQSNKTRRERIDKERAEMEALGLSPDQYWQKQLYDAEQNSEGVNRLGNAGPFLGLKNAVTAVPSVLAEGALRAIPNTLPYGLQASQLADTLARTRADDEAYSQYADKQQGAPSKYARQVTEMLTKYVPIGATTGPAGLLPFIFTEAQSGAYVEGQKAGLKGGALDAYANGIGTINAAFTYLGGKIAQKLGTGTIEEFGMQGVPLSTGVKDFFAKYLKGAASETLAEEVPTYLAENYARYVAGISEDAVPETWQQDLVDIAVVSTLAQSASSLSHVGDDTREFLENPTVETAKKAGLPTELVQTREDAESLAVQVADEIAEKQAEAAPAPETPVEEGVVDATQGPGLPAEDVPGAPKEVVQPPEPAIPVQADSIPAEGEAEKVENSTFLETEPRKRRLGDRVIPTKPGVYEGQTPQGNYRIEIKPSIGQRLKDAITGKSEPPVTISEDASGQVTLDAPFRVKEPTPSVAPPDAPPVAPSQAQADSGVPLWDMTPQELDEAYDAAQEADRTLLDRLFGVEGARRYRSAHARTGSMMATRAEMEEARNIVGDMEDSLTEDQRNELYGIGLPDSKNPEAIKPFRDAMGRIDDSTASSLGESIGARLIYLKDQGEPSEMNQEGQVAYAVLQEAMNRADEKGFSREEVSKAAVRRAASMFSDPNDAVYMLERFLPKKPQPTPSVGPRRLGDRKQTNALPAPPKKRLGQKKAEPAKVQEEAPAEQPPTKWYETLDEPTRESLFASMRSLGERSDRAYSESKTLSSGAGAIGVGSADFDPFLKADAIRNVLREVGRGKTPQEAAELAKAEARIAIEKHNAKRPKDINWGRADMSADSTIESAMRELLRATEPKKPVEPKSVRKPRKKAADTSVQASANTGEQLQPSKPKVIVTPPKSQRQIIAELSKALDIPIRFGRQLDRKAGGLFYRAQNIITSKFANDVPVVTHEVGHKLDSMFELSRDKTIKAELEKLGDPSTPGSRSSWTKSKSGVYKRGEGMAEFVRYWMTDPKKAKADAPGTYDAFEAVLDANKDLGDSMRQAQEDIRLWRTAEPQARLRSQISIGENPNKTRYSLSQLTRDLVDDLHYLRLASEDAKLGNPDLKPSENPYLLARNLRGSYGMASTFIQQGAVDFNSKDVALGTSLEDALKPVGGRINDFRDWIVAKRVLELESQKRPTGFVLSDAESVVKKLDSPEFQKAFNDVKRWNDAVLQYAVDAGLVTKSSAEAMRKMNQDYVPFHRLFEVGANEAPSNESTGKGSGLNPGKPGSLKRLKGSQRNVVDPLETMVKNAYAIITASEKSAISLAVADMAKLPNMGKWVEKVAGPMKETRFSINDIRDQLEDMGADLSGVDEKGGDDMLNIFRQATRPPKGENTISVVRDGKTEFYRLNRYLHDTFEALNYEHANTFVKYASIPAQVLRAGVTLEPSFNIANVLRDTFGAAVLNRYGALPFETTIRGTAALLNNPQLVAEWAAAGGRSAVEASYFDRKKMQQFLAERISKDLTPAERALIWAKSPLTLLRKFSTTMEEATRIGEFQINYNALKKAGMTDGEARRLAAFESRDRQDFSKGGAITPGLRHIAAFWNAQVQANVRLAQAFKERPVETISKGIAFVTIPKLIEQALNWDDEDYWERPQWERDVFYMFPIGKDDAGHTRFLRIPVPFELGIIFGTVPGRFLQWAKENNPDAVKGLPLLMAKQTVPIPNPSGIGTIAELYPDQGYSYFRGREIVPDSMADMPKDLQWTAQTSALAKKIGEATGLSPMKIDYFIESTTGGTGKVALGKQIPGERFFSNPLAVTGQPIADFYSIRDQLKEDSERIKATGEHQGFGPVMLSEFEDVGEKIGTLRNKSREETDPIKKAKLEDEAYQLTREMVQKYRENPEPEEAVQKYAEKQAKKVVLSSDRPVQKKRKLGSKEQPETDEEYQKRLADWEEGRDASLKWLRKHKDSPAVQAAIKEAAKDIPPFPQYKGKLDVKLGAKRKEWRAKYGDASRLIESLK